MTVPLPPAARSRGRGGVATRHVETTKRPERRVETQKAAGDYSPTAPQALARLLPCPTALPLAVAPSYDSRRFRRLDQSAVPVSLLTRLRSAITPLRRGGHGSADGASRASDLVLGIGGRAGGGTRPWSSAGSVAGPERPRLVGRASLSRVGRVRRLSKLSCVPETAPLPHSAVKVVCLDEIIVETVGVMAFGSGGAGYS
jgi:hypothetical protein